MTELLFALVAILVASGAAVVVLRYANLLRRTSTRRTFAISFPRGIKAEAVEDFARSLGGLQLPRSQRLLDGSQVVYEIVATEVAITFYVTTDAGSTDYVLGQLRSAIPGVRISETPPPQNSFNAVGELRLVGGERLLRVDRPEQVSASLLSALRPLSDGEHSTLQWVIAPAAASSTVDFLLWLGERLGLRQPPPKAKPDKRTRAKQEEPHLLAALRLGAASADQQRARQLLRRLLGACHVVNAPGTHLRRRWVWYWLTQRRLHLRLVPLLGYPFRLTAKEVAALIGVPMGDIVLPGLDLGAARQLPPAPELPPSGPTLAQSNYPGSKRRLTWGPRSLPYHAWVIGGTGSGKSALLHNLVGGYLGAGASVVLLDSKRDLALDVLASIPPQRTRDVVLLDPAADQSVVGLNLLAARPGERERTADQLVSLFTRLWPGYVGPRSQTCCAPDS